MLSNTGRARKDHLCMGTGYTGKILHVDLSTGDVHTESRDDAFYRTYMGCRGIGYESLLKRVPPAIEPFDPRNLLIFATGVMTGAPIPAACRFAVIGKSPLTGTAAESETGGFFGPELKKAGFDAVVVSGAAPQPVWLLVRDGRAQIKNAGKLAHLPTGEFETAVRSLIGSQKARVAQTGPAGMHRVLFANITNNLAHFNGRNGLGALMGAKNLRAVVAVGSQKIPWSDPKILKRAARQYGRISDDLPISKALYTYGTTAFAETLSKAGALPVDNFRHSALEDATPVSGDTYNHTLLKQRKGCYACPIRCKRVIELDHATYGVDPRYGGPEYETIAALGTNLNITDLKAIAKANEICNKYCMDTISAGMTIAFACECFEKGVIDTSHTDGEILRFGDPALVMRLLPKIAMRQGFGDSLAQGLARLADIWGVADQPFNMSIRGQEVPMHDPRVKVLVGLGYAVSTHGADHMNAPHDTLFTDPEAFPLRSLKPLGIENPLSPTRFTAQGIDTYVKLDAIYKVMDTLGLCVFGFAPRGSMPLDTLVACLNACTGWDATLDEMVDAARRGSLMARAFNYREGYRVAEDRLPARLFEAKPDGPDAGRTIFTQQAFNRAMRQYYQTVGCDPDTLKPSPEALREYGLDWVDELLKANEPGA